MEGIGGLAEIIGPIGVLVVVVVWALFSHRSGNGRVVVAKLDALRDDVGEIKGDVRELRAGLVRHLEDHANT